MRIVFCLLIFFLITGSLFADELADKQKELDDLNRQLEELDHQLLQNQNLKKEKQAALDEMDAKRKQLEARICELDASQCKAQEEWDKTKQELENTSQDIVHKKQNVRQLYNSAHELGEALVVSHYSQLLNINADAWIISDALLQADRRLNNLNADITSLEDDRLALEKKEEKDATYFKDVQWTKIVSKKKKSNYQKQIISLDQEVTSLDKEYQEALQRKTELEAAQEEMNSLITSLRKRIPSYKPAYSYKFSTPRLMWPVEGTLLRGYGDYKGANNRVSLHNDGIDISVEIGTKVRCVDKGIVAFAGRNGGSGRVVIIDHLNGFYTVYSHNDHIEVTLGDTVEKGTVLALSGQSGFTEEPCLHFEVRRDGKADDPLNYLE
ncbi:MAG: peptidoglycan DD-metalloendopeptidase family protein [Candidatus Cloacimonetes bacterium]|nr:peptidoglycan DD-metalloendopeptidase family protein [Candidatus Cloacimonadota bacterium]